MGITGDWDQRVTRRTLLRTGGSFAAAATLVGTLGPGAFARLPVGKNPFALGVASGDPTPNGVVIWTRLAPDPLVVGGGMRGEAYGVRYELASDEEFFHIIRRGAIRAVADEAHSVRAELDDLEPAHEYFYRFKSSPDVSPIERTRTAPARDATVDSLRFAFVSCQHFAHGYFTPYAHVAAADDIRPRHPPRRLHLRGARPDRVGTHAPAAARSCRSTTTGSATASTRPTSTCRPPTPRIRWLVTWDDHEVDNNYADLIQDPDAAAGQLHRPSRGRVPRLLGAHAAAPRPQARRARSSTSTAASTGATSRPSTCSTGGSTAPTRSRSATIHGAHAERILPGRGSSPGGRCSASSSATGCMEELATTTARWNVLAEPDRVLAVRQRPASRTCNGFGSGDNWDGYVAERAAAPELARRPADPQPGRDHRRHAQQLGPQRSPGPLPPRRPAGGHLVPGYLDLHGGDPGDERFVRLINRDNPHFLLRNNNRGYVRCTLDADAWTSEFRTVTTVTQRGAPTSTLATFAVENGRAGAQLIGAPPV